MLESFGSRQKNRKHLDDLLPAAARQDADHGIIRINIMLLEKLIFGNILLYRIEKRIPDKLHLHPVFSIKILLKRQNHCHPVYQPANLLNPSPTPGPNLGADIIHDRDVQFLGLCGQQKIKTGIIDENEQIRQLLLPALLYNPHSFPDIPKSADHLGNTHDRQFRNITD